MRIGPTLALALASCGPVLADDDTGAVSDTGDVAQTDTSEVAGPADFRETGPFAVTTTTGTLTTTSGCDLDWTFVEPAEWDVLVVLLHGWLRSREQQVINAEHLASWGVAVAVPDQCHLTLYDVDQEQNGLDAIELADDLGKGSVIYAGHSAGGLAAFVATARDPHAIAYLGLDPAEALGIGAALADDFDRPAYALIGVSGSCNLGNNFVPLLEDVDQGRSLRVTDADHCDFEDPTGPVCTAGCGTASNARFSDAEIRTTIRGLSAAFVVSEAGLDPTGLDWWTPSGAGYATLDGEGAIAEP